MQIIIVGAGKVGSSLTAQLIREHRVTVIDQEPKLIENIINVYDVMGICGNGASYEVQKEAEEALKRHPFEKEMAVCDTVLSYLKSLLPKEKEAKKL